LFKPNESIVSKRLRRSKIIFVSSGFHQMLNGKRSQKS